MTQITTGPIVTKSNPRTMTVLISDPELIEAAEHCSTPQERNELIEDFAEIGHTLTETYQTDQSVKAITDTLESQRKLEREEHERRRTEEKKRAEHQRILQRTQYEQQLALQEENFKRRLMAQSSELKREARRNEEQRVLERTQYQQEIAKLNSTVAELSRVVRDEAQESSLAVRRFEREAADLLKGLLSEVREQLDGGHRDQDRLVGLVEETLDGLTGDLKDDFRQAGLLLRTLSEREASRQAASSLREKTSNYKGVEFEKGLLRDLVEFSAARSGDSVEHTGANPENGSQSKKGDLLYTLETQNGPVRIVLEAKNRKLKYEGSQKYFLDEVRESRELRGAQYGIVVTTLQKNSDENGRPKESLFKDLGEGNFLVIVDEEQPYSVALRTALHWIHALEKKDDGVNADAELYERVLGGLGRIEDMCYRFRSIKGATTSAINGLTGLRDNLDQLDEDLEREIGALLGLLEPKEQL